MTELLTVGEDKPEIGDPEVRETYEIAVESVKQAIAKRLQSLPDHVASWYLLRGLKDGGEFYLDHTTGDVTVSVAGRPFLVESIQTLTEGRLRLDTPPPDHTMS